MTDHLCGTQDSKVHINEPVLSATRTFNPQAQWAVPASTSQLLSISILWPVPNYTVWQEGHIICEQLVRSRHVNGKNVWQSQSQPRLAGQRFNKPNQYRVWTKKRRPPTVIR